MTHTYPHLSPAQRHDAARLLWQMHDRKVQAAKRMLTASYASYEYRQILYWKCVERIEGFRVCLETIAQMS